jgi:hypothetical protein
VRAIRRVAAHAASDPSVSLVDEIILAVFEAPTHTRTDGWVPAISITSRVCFVPVPAITILERLAALAKAGRLD